MNKILSKKKYNVLYLVEKSLKILKSVFIKDKKHVFLNYFVNLLLTKLEKSQKVANAILQKKLLNQ